MKPTIRILVVSADAETRETRVKALRALPRVEVLVAASATEAVRRVNRRQPDLVIMDLLLPGRSGLEVGAALRRRPGGPRVVLVSLGGDGRSYGEDTRDLGIDAVIRRDRLGSELPPLIARLFSGRWPVPLRPPARAVIEVQVQEATN